MQLIQPSFEILDPNGYELDDIYKHIERCGRTCYQSESKITDGSAEPFVRRMIDSKHYAMLEHGTVYLTIPCNQHNADDYLIRMIIDKYRHNKYSRISGPVDMAYITTNLRVIVENGWQDDLKYMTAPTEFHIHRVSVKFICNRQVSHEFVRHRVFSFAQESTRYVGYSQKKSISEFNCDNESDICAAYKQGFTMREISELSSLSEWGIRKILVKNNIEIRGLNNKGNRVQDYFSKIDTPEKAYLLGLIQTDGSVRISKRNVALSITQHKDYYWYIKDMLMDFSDYVNVSNSKSCKMLQIGSKNIVNDLISLGIVPNKTYDQTSEDIDKLWQSIPHEYLGDFIRGLIDGDGYVSFFVQSRGVNESCNIGLCAPQKRLIDLIGEYIKEKFDYQCGRRNEDSVYKLYITNIKVAKKIGEWLYKHFQYPFGHPKKSSAWIKRIGKEYPIAKYKDPKFTLIIPNWLNHNEPETIFSMIRAFDDMEDTYCSARLAGWKPQQAATILPNALKTELIMTGFVDDNGWKHFFDLRAKGVTGAPHPQAKQLAEPLMQEFIKRGLISE